MSKIGIVITTYNYQINYMPWYLENLFKSLSSQMHDYRIDVLIVDNLSGDNFLSMLGGKCLEYSDDKIAFAYVTEKDYHYHFSSMNFGFYILNHQDHYDYFCFSVDDTAFVEQCGLSLAIEEFVDPNVGIVSCQCDYDNAPPELSQYDDSSNNNSMVVRIGECVNGQFMIFSREYMKAYEFQYPDILKSFGTESLLTYCCAAIDKYWVLCKKAQLNNAKKVESLRKYKQKGTDGYMTYSGITLEDLFQKGYSVGMGFQGFFKRKSRFSHNPRKNLYFQPHDPSLYDEGGKAKRRDDLFLYIKNNLFTHNSFEERYSKIR